MKTDFEQALIQLNAKDLEALTAEVKECNSTENKQQKLNKQLTVAEFWNIKRNRRIFWRRKYLTNQGLEVLRG